MTETHDLVTRLLAAIEATEKLALAASPGPWTTTAEHDEILAVDGIPVADGFALSGRQLRATVDHIIGQDPLATLRSCAADRRLIDIAFEHAAKIDGEWGCVHSADDIRGGRCPEQRPGDLDVIITLAERYGLAEQQGDRP